jgi:thiol-disulfide isomerase/thioredoxin
VIRHRGAQIALAIAGLLLFQALALLVYRGIESGREGTAAPFRFERLVDLLPAPSLLLERPDGSLVSIAPGRQDEAVLVHFWATWCPPCRKELPALIALGRELTRSGRVRVVAVATDPQWDQIRRFFKGELPPEVFRDATGSAYRAYRVSNLPDTYLVGEDGLVRIRFVGAQDWRSPAARKALLDQLERPGDM